MKKIISFIVFIALTINVVDFSVNAADNQQLSFENDYDYNYYVDNLIGEEAPEYLDVFNSVFQINAERLFLEKSNDEYSVYAYETREKYDNLSFFVYVDSELDEFKDENFYNTKSEYLKIMNIDDNGAEITKSLKENKRYGYLYYIFNVEFISDNHDNNYKASKKLIEYLNGKYELDNSYVSLDKRVITAKQKVIWSEMYTIDEFGYQVSLYDELTKKQIDTLNEEFKEKGYDVIIDTSTGLLSYGKKMTEFQKLMFADYFRKEHGYFTIMSDVESLPSGNYLDMKLKLQPSNIVGDIDNDDSVKINDLVLLNKWLLLPDEYLSFNSENADINKDGIIDIFDLVLLRRFFTDEESEEELF